MREHSSRYCVYLRVSGLRLGAAHARNPDIAPEGGHGSRGYGSAMTTVRQRRKTRVAAPKVRQPAKALRSRAVVEDVTLRSHWDARATVELNFRRAGLATRLNRDVGCLATQKRAADWAYRRGEQLRAGDAPDFDSEEEIFEQLNEVIARTEAPASGESAEKPAALADLEAAAKAAHERRIAVRPPGTKDPLSEDEQTYMAALIQRHGADNFAAMYRDSRLNYNQLSVRQLERLAGRM